MHQLIIKTHTYVRIRTHFLQYILLFPKHIIYARLFVVLSITPQWNWIAFKMHNDKWFCTNCEANSTCLIKYKHMHLHASNQCFMQWNVRSTRNSKWILLLFQFSHPSLQNPTEWIAFLTFTFKLR